MKALMFGLLGHNIGYSRSVEIFQTIFDIEGIAGEFRIYDIGPRQFKSAIAQLLNSGVTGLCVTIPHKQRILNYLTGLHPVAQALQAVNSVAIEGDRISGFNTDCVGFSWPLQEHNQRLKHGSALIFGNGGGARAAVYSLFTDFEISKFTICGRSSGKLSRFRSSLGKVLKGAEFNLVQDVTQADLRGHTFDVAVNCTPLGGPNQPGASPVPEGIDWSRIKIYCDLNYNQQNRVVQAANEAGTIGIDGSRMLVAQAVQSFDIWTGRATDQEKVYRAVFQS